MPRGQGTVYKGIDLGSGGTGLLESESSDGAGNKMPC